jgi:two-component system LytT family sensor kinase
MDTRHNLPRPALVLLVWMGLGLVFGTYAYLNLALVRKWPPPFVGLGIQVIHYWVWGILSLLILALLRRFPLVRGNLWRALAVHIPASLGIGALQVGLFVWLIHVVGINNPQVPFSQRLQIALNNEVPSAVLTYWIFVGTALGYSYYRRYAERDLQAARLETQLAEARLRVLKMQLDPHFLFNTLNSISALMRRDLDAADSMLEGLSQLLRMSLAYEAHQEVSLREELDFLELYLSIQQARFRDRLTVAMDIEPDALDALVPHMILQPAAENALQHAVSSMTSGARITVAAYRANGDLVMRVADNGPGFVAGAAASKGVGLQNTRRRLEALYAGEFQFRTENAPAGGAVVHIQVPFRLAAHPAPAGG